jgi:hypothetical protein
MRRRHACAILLLALAPALCAGEELPVRRPGREVSLSPSAVKDTFFAYFLGIITAGVDIDIDNGQMREILTEFKSHPDLPFDLIARVWQATDAGSGARRIGLDFTRDVDIPVPFSLLFYHPGSIVADRSLVFEVDRSSYADPSAPSVPAPVLDLRLAEGAILADIDDWLEVVFSAYLEDAWIHHVVFFTWNGEWIGLLEGTGTRTVRDLRAYFNFTRNRIVFPVPIALDRAGREILP